MLNVALIMAVVEQRPVLPFAGVTSVTVGAVVGGVCVLVWIAASGDGTK